MALIENIRSKIVRQELDLAEAGPSFARYEAKVKYLPENIEKPEFFNLCYGMLKKGDEISIYTYKKDAFEAFYKFLVLDVDRDAKTVTTLMLKKVDLKNPEISEAEEVGIDPDVLNAAIIKVVDAKLKELVAEVTELKEAFTKYTTETDDQLEEIENNIEALNGQEETEEVAEE